MTDREQALLEEREELRRECDRLREALEAMRAVAEAAKTLKDRDMLAEGSVLYEALAALEETRKDG